MHNFKELRIWQESMELVKQVYEITSTFPSNEKYGLTSQINRCSVSIPSNIAEGAGRNSDKEFSQFLSIAQGSSFELETQLILANSLNLIDSIKLENLLSKLNSIQKMIRALKKSLSKEFV